MQDKKILLSRRTLVEGTNYLADYQENISEYSSTERCTLVGNAFECLVVGPVLKNYLTYPEMIRVPYDYCQK